MAKFRTKEATFIYAYKVERHNWAHLKFHLVQLHPTFNITIEPVCFHSQYPKERHGITVHFNDSIACVIGWGDYMVIHPETNYPVPCDFRFFDFFFTKHD